MLTLLHMTSVARLRATDAYTSSASSPPPALRLVGGAQAPRPVLDPAQLTYHLLRPREAGPADLPLLGLAYECWGSVWREHFLERDNTDYLPSDDFTRQDEIGALFHGWECVGMTFYRWVDLTNPIYADDSYFRVWPRSALETACASGKRLCIGSNLTVSPRWRNAKNVSAKRVLLALAVERFLRADADTMVGKMRNDRNMNELGFELGFERIERDVLLHGGPCDLVAFYRGKSRRGTLDPANEDVIRGLLP
jgi:hypothetical protein